MKMISYWNKEALSAMTDVLVITVAAIGGSHLESEKETGVMRL